MDYIINYDETKIPTYTLPDPLIGLDGAPVRDAADWQTRRRPELLRLFEQHVYGRIPDADISMGVGGTLDTAALNGLATRKEVTLTFGMAETPPQIHLLLYVPNAATGRVPAFLGLNFFGNHTIHPDPGITVGTVWTPVEEGSKVLAPRPAKDTERGLAASRWPVERILERGYALATAYCGDSDPDFDDGFHNGVHALLPRDDAAGDAWATFGAWAWSLSRIMDYFEMDPHVDERRVAVLGHSRLGKAAVWAGAADERFALVISNNSGCGGAALSRRRIGETVRAINERFPHWFCTNFKQYNDHEDALPVDQHMLLALIAPRPLYVASAEEDRWSDPRGEFLGALHADPVYRLFGVEGLPVDEMPDLERPVMGKIAYHIRTGKHDVTAYDWEQYLNFADRHLGHS